MTVGISLPALLSLSFTRKWEKAKNLSDHFNVKPSLLTIYYQNKFDGRLLFVWLMPFSISTGSVVERNHLVDDRRGNTISGYLLDKT